MPTVITPSLETVVNTGSQDLFTISVTTTTPGINPGNVVIANTAGGFTTNTFSSYNIGDTVTVSGTEGGTGVITAYTDPTTYFITATDQSSSFVLSATEGGANIVTTAGSTTGLTFVASGSAFPPVIGATQYSTVTSPQQVTFSAITANVGTDIINKWLPGLPSTGRVPSMDFACYSLDQYQWHSGDRSIPLLGSHGCVRQCSFCDVIKQFTKYSFVEADQLTQDIIQAWNQTGIHRVQFMDSLVNGSMSNFLLLLKNLAHARQQGWLPQEFSWSGTYICRPPSSLLDQIHEVVQTTW